MSAAELFARGESNRTEQVVDAVEDPSPSRVGPLGTCTAPAQLGAGGATHGEPCPPAPLSREDRGTPGRVSAAAETLPSHLLAVPAAAREGGDQAVVPDRLVAPRILVDDNGCWIWQGAIDLYNGGYGKVNVNGQSFNVHRLVYQVFVGPVPRGLQLDHLCRVKACCNPSHLEPVTAAENNARKPGASRTHCRSGHELTPDNVYEHSTGWRECRICRRAKKARYRAARRAEKRAAS